MKVLYPYLWCYIILSVSSWVLGLRGEWLEGVSVATSVFSSPQQRSDGWRALPLLL